MKSIKEIYRIGTGPSSSHTMGPKNAALKFLHDNPDATSFKVKLYSSLASTGKGHLTDKILNAVFSDFPLEIEWIPGEELPEHPNGMIFEAFDMHGIKLNHWKVFSVGGGEIFDPLNPRTSSEIYQLKNLKEIIKSCEEKGLTLWEFVFLNEDKDIISYLEKVMETMFNAIKNGLENDGVLPGGIGLPRKAATLYRKTKLVDSHLKKSGLLYSYALAVAEENASGGLIVTAPTCGSCGVVPAVLYSLNVILDCSNIEMIKALATAGLIGNLVKENASISGAKVGCQGEIGTACAMASAAATQLAGGSIRQIEYAAEMGLEHHLGLTCDPVYGLVQIPCIERNAFAARRALDCAEYSLFSDGSHIIPFDDVVEVMKRTGNDLPSLYRETSLGGLASVYKK